jgi:cytidylate kinase
VLITISGLPGSGKTTVARELSQRLGVPHIYAGDLYRREAEERALSLEEFSRLAEKDHSIDRALDAKMAEYARRGGMVLEGRLAAFIALQEQVDALKVWLTASEKVRAQRVSQRENSDSIKVLRENEERQRSDARRYREIYGFDLNDTSIYDLILDSDHANPEALEDKILACAADRFGCAAVRSVNR